MVPFQSFCFEYPLTYVQVNAHLGTSPAVNDIQVLRAFGGGQAIISNTTILDGDGSLGPRYPRSLIIGDV
jgi:hypothetical protein